MISILIKVFTKQFYSAHTGFFFLVLFFGVGFMRKVEHEAIAQYIASNDFLTLLLILVFFLFQVKVRLFTKSLLQKGEYSFVRELIHIKSNRLICLLSIPQILNNSLLIFYSLFVSSYMWQLGAYHRLIMICCYLLASIFIPTFLIIRQIKRPLIEPKTILFSQLVHKNLSKPFFIWYPIHLLKNRPLLYFLTKILSISVLVGFFIGYELEGYDWRFLAVGVVASSGLNLILVFDYYEFAENQLAFFRNLPASSLTRIWRCFLSILILLLPEILVVIRKIPSDIPFDFILEATLFTLISPLFYFQWTILKKNTIKELAKACFYFSTAIIFLILFSVPLYALTIVMIIIILMIQNRYYRLHKF